MSNNPWPAGYDRQVFDTLDSTNAEAARRADEALRPTWILALGQTAARGRRGRAWAMQEGNFAATLLMRPEEPPEVVALRSFVAALALYDALVAVTGRAQAFSLKWPNDVLLNGGKLAGILLESTGRGAGVAHLAIGIGVNLADAPDASQLEAGAVRPVSLAGSLGLCPTPEEFLDHLAPAYATHEERFRTFGFQPIRAAWLARAARLGQVITARLPGREVTGTFEDVDQAGNLVMATPKGREVVPAAEVFF